MHQNRSYSSIGNAIKGQRKLQGITQRQLALLAGMAERTVSQLEGGMGQLSSLLAVCDALSVTVTGRGLPPGDSIGQRLSALRTRQELSMRSIAEVGISAATISAIESNSVTVNVSAIEKYATALGISLKLISVDEDEGYWETVANSSAHSGWTTPRWLSTGLALACGRAGKFDLDPCSPFSDGRASPVPARRFLTSGGLERPWKGVVFMNPPFADASAWTKKAKESAIAGATVIGLLPARTGTKWFHTHVAGHADIWLLQGRLKFGDETVPAPFDCMITAWNADHGMRLKISELLSDAFHISNMPEAFGRHE